MCVCVSYLQDTVAIGLLDELTLLDSEAGVVIGDAELNALA